MILLSTDFRTEDEELLLDAPEIDLSNPTAVIPQAADQDTDMHIDEEGRPRFAPAKDTVSYRGHSPKFPSLETKNHRADPHESKLAKSPSHRTA
jgi:hypothetical protein